MTQMIVLCGGRGTRLNPTTEVIPKALIHVAGKPIIQHIVEIYSKKGIKDYIFCIGYKGDKIIDFFHANKINFNGLNFDFVDSGEEASMLERIYQGFNKIDDEAIITYGDTINPNLNFDKLLEEHRTKNSGLTLVKAKIMNPFGILNYDDSGRVLTFKEKPVYDYYIGTFVSNNQIMKKYVTSDLRQAKDAIGLIKFFDDVIARGNAYVHSYEGKQLTFNTELERGSVESDIIEFYTLNEAENGR